MGLVKLVSANTVTEHTANLSTEWLDIDNVEDIDKSEESRNSGWKELVIPHKFSKLLLSLVSNHISDVRVRQWEALARNDSPDQIDLVRGKGRGLIILLHGQFPTYYNRIPGPIASTLWLVPCVQEFPGYNQCQKGLSVAMIDLQNPQTSVETVN